jgi:uncharacterized protein
MEHEQITQRIKTIVHREDPKAQVILYGSRARGDYSAESDWDFLILLTKANVSYKDEQNIRHKIYEVELETGESISTFVYSLENWNTRLRITPFYRSVSSEGIYL